MLLKVITVMWYWRHLYVTFVLVRYSKKKNFNYNSSKSFTQKCTFPVEYLSSIPTSKSNKLRGVPQFFLSCLSFQTTLQLQKQLSIYDDIVFTLKCGKLWYDIRETMLETSTIRQRKYWKEEPQIDIKFNPQYQPKIIISNHFPHQFRYKYM